MHPKMDATPKTPPVDIYGGAPKNGCNSKTPPAVIYIATSGHGHKSHTTRMEHPAQNAGVDQVLKCAQDNLAAFKMAVDTEDVAALRSMLRKMNPQYDAACKQYGVPNALEHQTSSGFLPSFVPGFLQSAAPTTSAKSRRQDKKEKREKAAAALEAKACEVAAGMDLRVDENGQLVTTVNATKAMSDEEMQRLGLWLPPVGFDECNGDIFKIGEYHAASGFWPSANSAFEPHVKKVFGVEGAGTFSTDSYKQCKQTDMVGAADSEFSDEQYDAQYVSNIETSVVVGAALCRNPGTKALVGIVIDKKKMPFKYPASVQDGGMWMEVKRWNPV
jgi:hypothetical protein